MKLTGHQAKVSATISPHLMTEVDALVQAHEYATRSSVIEAALRHLLRAKMDALIEGEASKLIRSEETAEAEWGMDDFQQITKNG